MRFDDVLYAVKSRLSDNPRQVILATVAGVLFLVAIAMFGRMILGPAPSSTDVEGLQRRARREARSDLEQVRREREKEAEQLRRAAESQGEDPEADPRRATGG